MSFESLGQSLDDRIASFKWRWRQRWRRLTGQPPIPETPSYISMTEVTREAIKLWKNNNAFLQHMHDKKVSSEMVGQSIRIRLPDNYQPKDPT